MAEAQLKLEITASRLFVPWLASAKASLAFTTYQAGKLFLIGLQPDGRLSIFERSFPRCWGWASAPAARSGCPRSTSFGVSRTTSSLARARTATTRCWCR